MNIPMTPMEATGWTIATLVLILALWFFYSFIIYPKQHEKIKRQKERREEEESRKNADNAFSGYTPLPKNRQARDYENSFAETELMATSL